MALTAPDAPSAGCSKVLRRTTAPRPSAPGGLGGMVQAAVPARAGGQSAPRGLIDAAPPQVQVQEVPKTIPIRCAMLRPK